MCELADVVCIQCGHPVSAHMDDGVPGFCCDMLDEEDEDGGHRFCGCGALLEDDDGDAATGFQ